MKEERAQAAKAKKAGQVASTAAALAGPGQLCSPTEGNLFTCRSGRRIVAICTSGPVGTQSSWIEYRAGLRDRLELSHRTNTRGGVSDFYGAYDQYARGEVSYIRFVRQEFEYVAFTDEASRPQRSGVLIRKIVEPITGAAKTISELSCDGGMNGNGMPSDSAKMPSNLIEPESLDPRRVTPAR